ncbi:3-oxoacid CoA-transferase subunit B [Sneathiella chinensis]|uniref:3-oxoadipate CoA-transferase subunit B n=1 Tax=Sneathiella chinensis TaxID=349750 RepID=A0ABQ5U6M1_9PROT|nr:3-oxoacid CoA-transferase subunit B [Sneathiella chinensis]GLQ06805.1 3-oxoadipate CoA-transferase subunit B [Sneathiella chinensis]
MSNADTKAGLSRPQMAWRAAQDLVDGAFVNLGIGIPEMVADFVPGDRQIIYHTENGILGFGPRPAEGEEDPDLINAGKKPVTLLPGASFFHHADSFAMIRGGHIDYCILGAMQVSASGDLANWSTGAPDAIPAVGGAMDLVAGVPNVFIITDHVTRTGEPKLLETCTYPLTATGVVKRVFTDFGVFDVTASGFVLKEIAPGVTVDMIVEKTGAAVEIPADLKVIEVPDTV